MSKYTKNFYIPLPAKDIDQDALEGLDPQKDADEIKELTSILAYRVHGAKIMAYHPSEFVMVEVVVHLYQVGFIRDTAKTSS